MRQWTRGRIEAPVEAALALLEQVDAGAVGDQERDRGLDGALQDLGRVAERRQRRGQLAQRLLDLDPPRRVGRVSPAARR